MDHAALSVEILSDTGVLQHFSGQERSVVLTAIELHNKYRIPDILDDQSRLHAKILRDADKLDIFRVVTEYYEQRMYRLNPAMEENMSDTEGYNPQIVQDILNNRNTLSQQVKNINDTRLFKLSWVYDINFTVTLQALKERNYIEAILNNFPDTPDIRQLPEAFLELH